MWVRVVAEPLQRFGHLHKHHLRLERLCEINVPLLRGGYGCVLGVWGWGRE